MYDGLGALEDIEHNDIDFGLLRRLGYLGARQRQQREIEMSSDYCGACSYTGDPCVLPVGHNIGNVDIPRHHLGQRGCERWFLKDPVGMSTSSESLTQLQQEETVGAPVSEQFSSMTKANAYFQLDSTVSNRAHLDVLMVAVQEAYSALESVPRTGITLTVSLITQSTTA